MSLLFGGGKKTKPQYSSLQVQTSSSNMPVTLAWGLCRLSPNLIWYGDFAAHKQKAQGGKGGGGKGGAQYKYTTALAMALCQGVSGGIPRVFVDNDKNSSLSKLNLVFFSGTDVQSPWSYLTTNHPTQALNYPGLVYVASPKYDLGNSASLPQHSFETQCRLYNTAPGGVGDADVALVIQDYLTAPVWGCGFPSADLDTVSLLSSGGPDAATQTYCTAMGFGMSPALASQENGLSILDRWCKIFNIAPVWNGAALKFIPYALEPVSGNGKSFVPVTTSAYTLTDDDYVGSPSSPDDPVKIKRVDYSKVKNRLKIEILSRAKEYNAVPVEYVEQALVDQHGDLPDGVFQAHEVADATMATKIVTIMCIRNAYRGANTYTFTLGPEFCLLEPMDLLTIVDPQLGTVQVQIDEIDEDDDFNLAISASMVATATTGVSGFSPPDQTPGGNDTGLNPGSVNTPIIFEPASTLTSGVAQVWAAVSGGVNWGGCFVWVSTDNATYTEIGEIQGPARTGVTTTTLAAFGGTNPDTTDSVGVDLSQSLGTLTGVSATDAANAVTLCYLGGELLSYRDALLTTTSHYTLGGQLYRGLYGTSPASHASGVPFARLDDAVFKYTLPVQYIGQTLYFKFQSYNIYGGGVQDLSVCTAYTLTPVGTGFGGGAGGVPTTPTGLAISASTGNNTLTWNANPATDNVQHYDVFRAPGPGGLIGSATKIGSSASSNYTDSTAAAGTVYTYFVKAVNAVGSSSPSTGVDITSTAAAAVPFGFAFQTLTGAITVSTPFIFFDVPGGITWTIPAGMTNSKVELRGTGAVAPTAQTDFDVQSPPGTSIGTIRFAASGTSATFIKASQSSLPAGQTVQLVAPANLNGMTGTLYGDIMGTR